MDSRQCRAGAAAVACAVFAAGTASADAIGDRVRPSDRPTVTVRVDDLNHASEAGAQTMYARLRAATQRVCGTPERDLRAATAIRACRRHTLAAAVASADVPRLTALHEARTGQRTRHGAARVAATR